ncbi:glutathione peroxidase [Lutibacter maritimus]|uniref:Glutathione peroxidase n=2 Tax=Lutibacter maritimus TaxID=593133 RepID=A0A1I6SRR6_9FLAO|nr:glutathione peroxidase [Lutibacter maritimus]
MKKIIYFSFLCLLTISCKNNAQEKKEATNLKQTIMQPKTPIYTIAINNLNGDPINLADYKGKKILFVNVASECGFTPQYKDLQELHKTYGEKLVVIGLPCNQFGEQEPGSASEIQDFCSKNYGVEFLITEKIDVKGANQHSLYAWLTNKDLNGSKSSTVKWNFQKYLVDEQGNFIDFYYSITNPLATEITSKI